MKRPAKRSGAVAVHPFDRLHGTDTSGLLPGTAIAQGTTFPASDLTAYYGVAPSILHAMVELWLQEARPLPRIEETVFLDIGAGKGRAMMLASQHPFLRVEGVELNAGLAAQAQNNLARWASDPHAEALAPLHLRIGDATRSPLPAVPTVAFLFHPFETKLLRRFVRHVVRSVDALPRPFHLLYVNAEHSTLLDRDPALRRLWLGRVPMSPDDHVADLEAIAEQEEYGSTGDELCAIYGVTDGTARAEPTCA